MRVTGNRMLSKYGPWAVVAGASAGLGEAFARALAGRGFNLVLFARRSKELRLLAEELESREGIEARTVALDLCGPELMETLAERTGDLDVGLLVYNAAFSNIGPFLDRTLEDHLRLVGVNCSAPLTLVHYFGGKMRQRGRGGILLMSSLAAFQGTAYIANNGASKGFNLLLCEGLWYELKGCGIDVLACCAGPTDTPGYRESLSRGEIPVSPGLMKPASVAESALKSLGKRPYVVPGFFNKATHFLMSRIMSRKMAVRLMGATISKMYS
ncbi:MAG TPA: SDR family NAD(P)-dependent oxidoreductase [Spirochaetia bacterium]|nr:SDR family NAD(P)-dependent oxidoreductase [Spirochaetia bacterium]